MTMADERTRALRYGWEFLLSMRDEPRVTDEQRSVVDALLRHYPSGAEIKAWAMDCEQLPDRIGAWRLAPEAPRATYPVNREPVYPETIERGPTTPQERARALCGAYEFFW